MPTTDLCLRNIYEPGNIPSTSGEPPTRPTPDFIPSLDFSIELDSQLIEVVT